MEIFDQIAWIFFIGLIFYFALRSQLREDPVSFESEETRGQLQAAMNRIFSSCDLQSLKKNTDVEIQRFPKYQDLLLQTYHQQIRIIEDFQNGYRYAIERIRAVIYHQLEQCRSLEDFHALKSACANLIRTSTPIANLFDNYQIWLSRRYSRNKETRKSQRSKKKDLFSKCHTEEEIKRRFRRLAFLNHPDRGGKEAAMKEVLKQYEEALERLTVNSRA